MNLPAGITPGDLSVELFAKPNEFGKCYFLHNGQTRSFDEMADKDRSLLQNKLIGDKKAIKYLGKMGIPANAMLEQYNFCNRGKLDSTPDITQVGKLSKEYFDCGQRGKCIGEGRVCSMAGLTFRERQCLQLAGAGKDYAAIKEDMGFRSTIAVNSLMTKLRMKLDAKSKSELCIRAYEMGIV